MAEKSTKKPKPILKPVSFTENNETDVKIMKYIDENNLAFSSYVKDLILTDMRKIKDKNEIAEAINNLANIISKSGFTVINKEEDINNDTNDNSVVDEEKKSIIGNLMNMSK